MKVVVVVGAKFGHRQRSTKVGEEEITIDDLQNKSHLEPGGWLQQDPLTIKSALSINETKVLGRENCRVSRRRREPRENVSRGFLL